MTEEERNEMILKTSQKIEEIKSLHKLEKEISKLEKTEIIKKYLDCKKKLAILKKYTQELNREDKQIFGIDVNQVALLEFDRFIHKCEHDIWIKSNENYTNEYVCLECAEAKFINKLDTERIRDFEENHFVLKMHSYHFNISNYRKLYYGLLYEKSSIEEAQKELIRIFNENENSNKSENKKVLMKKL